MAYVARAGYDATAQVDVLRTLLASQELETALAGGDPRRAGSGGRDHPALADRLRQAARGLAGVGGDGARGDGARGRGAYLAAIDGMVFGDGPAQGSCTGGLRPPRPALRLRPAAGLRGRQRARLHRRQRATHGDDAPRQRPRPGGDPATYLVRGWVPEIARGVGAGGLDGPRPLRIGGLPAAEARLSLANGGSRGLADLTVIRYRGRLDRLTGLYEPGDAAAAAALARAAASFRPLSRGEAAAAPPLRIRIHRIAAGDDVKAMAGGMPIGAASRAWFDLINGLRPGRSLRVGDAIKLVSE